MIVTAATYLTNAVFPRQQHREMTGLKRKWIHLLRKHDAYYHTLYRTYHQEWKNPELIQIHLEPTNGCNLKCVTCNNTHSPVDKGKMPFDMACKIIDEAWEEIGDQGVLGLFIRGESVIHPQLADMIKYARQKGFRKILLSTNVMLLTDERARRLLQSGLTELRLSVDAVDAETFEKTRAGSNFGIITQNLEALHRARKDLGSSCHFRLHAALHRQSFERIPEFIRRWHHMIQTFKFTVAVNQGGLFAEEQAYRFSGLRFAVSSAWKIPCRILYNYVGVTWDGKLTSCCVDYREKFVVGEIGSGVNAGFLNDKSESIRQDHLKGDFGDLCRKCGFNNILVDWFEDEINDLVSDSLPLLLDEKKDADFKTKIIAVMDRFERLAQPPPQIRTWFG